MEPFLKHKRVSRFRPKQTSVDTINDSGNISSTPLYRQLPNKRAISRNRTRLKQNQLSNIYKNS